MNDTRQLLKEFREFILRGNVVDLAVAVVIGTAFTAVVKALVTDIITPIVSMLVGKSSLGALKFTINGSDFLYGDLLNVVLTFLATAAGPLLPGRQAGQRADGPAQARRGARARSRRRRTSGC